MGTSILSPALLWDGFPIRKMFQESKTDEKIFDNVIYSEYYFSGRDVNNNCVRIFGVYAHLKDVKNRASKGGLLIIPDACDTIDYEVMSVYAKQGYSVLMIDYRGQTEGVENFTKYPQQISYANYSSAGKTFFVAETSARETCWYEWVAVAKYAIAFLKSRDGVEKVGVLGIKAGADIGWQACASNEAVSCFVPLFGAGWRAYKGYNKFGELDVELSGERLRFVAGLDAHSYAQYVTCPVFYMSPTNNPDYDVDRCTDTLLRIQNREDEQEKLRERKRGFIVVDDKGGEESISKSRKIKYSNASIYLCPRFNDVLDAKAKRNVDLFLAKYLLNFPLTLPQEPSLTVKVENKKVTLDASLDFSDVNRTKSVRAFIAEDGVISAFRAWEEMSLLKSNVENEKRFVYEIKTKASFINVFVVVEYKSGVTISSKILSKKLTQISARKYNLIYSTREKNSSISIGRLEKNSLGGLFFMGEPYSLEAGKEGILGLTSSGVFDFYKFNSSFINLHGNSMIKLDLCTKDFARVKFSLICYDDFSKEYLEYTTEQNMRGVDLWQNVLIRVSDFKFQNTKSIKDFNSVLEFRIESTAKILINNLLIL